MTQYALINSSYKGIDGYIRYVNDTSGGIMLPLFLLVGFIVLLVSQLEYGFQRAFLVSSFVVSILSIILTIIGFLSPAYMYLSFIFVGIGVLLVRLTYTP